MSLRDDMNREGAPQDVDPNEAFGGKSKGPYLPPGEYLLGIKREYSDYIDTKKGGKMLKLDLKVLSKEQEGRRLFPTFNVVNANPDVAERAQKKVQAIWEACGGNPNAYPELDQFFGEKFIGKTGLEWDDYKDGDYNPVLWGVRSLDGDPPAGRRPDDQMPDIWEEAVEYAREQQDDEGPAPSNDSGGSRAGHSDSFDDDDIPF